MRGPSLQVMYCLLCTLAHKRCGCNFKNAKFEHLLFVKFTNISCGIALGWMSLNTYAVCDNPFAVAIPCMISCLCNCYANSNILPLQLPFCVQYHAFAMAILYAILWHCKLPCCVQHYVMIDDVIMSPQCIYRQCFYRWHNVDFLIENN